jgi:CheY-like chemotaxis protein
MVRTASQLCAPRRGCGTIGRGYILRPSNPDSPRAWRVLVIDDDEIALEATRSLLADAGFEVHCLASPIGATQVIMSKQIEAVVVDLNMPVMQGDRFIRLLRSWDKIRTIPTILLSGAPPATLQVVTKDLPGVVTISKNTMHRVLPETVKRLLCGPRRSSAEG